MQQTDAQTSPRSLSKTNVGGQDCSDPSDSSGGFKSPKVGPSVAKEGRVTKTAGRNDSAKRSMQQSIAKTRSQQRKSKKRNFLPSNSNNGVDQLADPLRQNEKTMSLRLGAP